MLEAVSRIGGSSLNWSSRYPSIAVAVGKLGCRSCLVDGEVVICGEDGIPVFDRLRYGRQVKRGGAALCLRPARARRAGSTARGDRDPQGHARIRGACGLPVATGAEL